MRKQRSRDEVRQAFEERMDFDFTSSQFDLSHYDQIRMMEPKSHSC